MNIFLLFLLSLKPLPPLPLASCQQKSDSGIFQSSTVSTTTQTTCLSMIKPATSVASTTTPTGIVKPTPSIAVTQTQSIEREEKALANLSQRSKPSSPNKRKDIKKHVQHKSKHSAIDRVHRQALHFNLLALMALGDDKKNVWKIYTIFFPLSEKSLLS